MDTVDTMSRKTLNKGTLTNYQRKLERNVEETIAKHLVGYEPMPLRSAGTSTAAKEEQKT